MTTPSEQPAEQPAEQSAAPRSSRVNPYNQRRKASNQARVRAAVDQLLGENVFINVSLVARRAGLSRQTLYKTGAAEEIAVLSARTAHLPLSEPQPAQAEPELAQLRAELTELKSAIGELRTLIMDARQ